jgi:WD40 repeat protein
MIFCLLISTLFSFFPSANADWDYPGHTQIKWIDSENIIYTYKFELYKYNIQTKEKIQLSPLTRATYFHPTKSWIGTWNLGLPSCFPGEPTTNIFTIIDYSTNIEIKIYENISGFKWSPIGNYFLIIMDKNMSFYSCNNFELIGNIPLNISGAYSTYDIEWSPDENLIAIPTGTNLTIYDRIDLKAIKVLDEDVYIQLKFSPNSKYLVAYPNSGSVTTKVWEMHSWNLVYENGRPHIPPEPWSKNGEYLLLKTYNSYVSNDNKWKYHMVSSQNWEDVKTFNVSEDYDSTLIWSPNGRYFAIISSKERHSSSCDAIIYEMDSIEIVFEHHFEDSVTVVEFSPDNNKIAVGFGNYDKKKTPEFYNNEKDIIDKYQNKDKNKGNNPLLLIENQVIVILILLIIIISAIWVYRKKKKKPMIK